MIINGAGVVVTAIVMMVFAITKSLTVRGCDHPNSDIGVCLFVSSSTLFEAGKRPFIRQYSPPVRIANQRVLLLLGGVHKVH
jgi:hypothetical protein